MDSWRITDGRITNGPYFMSTTDCLILGFYELPFDEYAETVRSLGETSGVHRDLALAYLEHEGRPYRALDILNRCYNPRHGLSGVTFHNADFLWPVITYLTTFLRKRGHQVDYVNLPHLQREELKCKLTSGLVRSVAITTTLYVSPEPIIELVSLVRRLNSKAKIIVGGPFISNQYRADAGPGLSRLFDRIGADIYVLCQEGEATLSGVLDELRSGRNLARVPNLALRGETGYSFTPEKPESNDLAMEPVDYAGFPVDELHEFVTIRTAKSCPFSCAFCGFPIRAGKYTYLDLGQVEREFDAIAARGNLGTLTILDDTFNVPKRRFREILKLLIDKNYGFRWNSFYRADHGDEETIGLMAEAGCEGVFLGVESGSDKILEGMNKTARRHHYLDAISAFSANGISTYASLIVGFPGETDATVEETIRFIEEARPEYFRAQLWYADPLTPIWSERHKYGVSGQGFSWRHATMDAERACDWIDEMFLRVKNSTWLPQFGFEQWALFYLQRKGMSRKGVRDFVETFNTAIRHRMFSFDTVLPPAILTALEASAVFPGPGADEMRGLQAWSAARYDAAGALLSTELSSAASQAVPTSLVDAPLQRVDVQQIEMPGVAKALREGREEGLIHVLAAYAASVTRSVGTGVILVAPGGGADHPPAPMYFTTNVDAPFEHWLEEARKKWRTLIPEADILARIFASSPRHGGGNTRPRATQMLRLPSHTGSKVAPWMDRIGRWGVTDVLFVSPGASGRSLIFEVQTSDARRATGLREQLSMLIAQLREMTTRELMAGGAW